MTLETIITAPDVAHAKTLGLITDAARTYGGITSGPDTEGLVTVTFPDMVRAAAFVVTNGLTRRATIRNVPVTFDEPVTVQFRIVSWRMYAPTWYVGTRRK